MELFEGEEYRRMMSVSSSPSNSPPLDRPTSAKKKSKRVTTLKDRVLQRSSAGISSEDALQPNPVEGEEEDVLPDVQVCGRGMSHRYFPNSKCTT